MRSAPIRPVSDCLVPAAAAAVDGVVGSPVLAGREQVGVVLVLDQIRLVGVVVTEVLPLGPHFAVVDRGVGVVVRPGVGNVLGVALGVGVGLVADLGRGCLLVRRPTVPLV